MSHSQYILIILLVAALIVRTVLTQTADKVPHRSRCRQPGAWRQCGEVDGDDGGGGDDHDDAAADDDDDHDDAAVADGGDHDY